MLRALPHVAGLANVWFRVITWAWVPMQFAMLVFAVELMSSGRLTLLEVIAVTISTGIISGTAGITFAHELVHRPGAFERALGEVLLASAKHDRTVNVRI